MNQTTFSAFRDAKQLMSAQQMLDSDVAVEMLDDYTDKDGNLLETHTHRQFLVYPANLVIEVVTDVAGASKENPLYHLRVGNMEQLVGVKRLEDIERELYQYARDEGRLSD